MVEEEKLLKLFWWATTTSKLPTLFIICLHDHAPFLFQKEKMNKGTKSVKCSEKMISYLYD
jgi:hypothetical protein